MTRALERFRFAGFVMSGGAGNLCITGVAFRFAVRFHRPAAWPSLATRVIVVWLGSVLVQSCSKADGPGQPSAGVDARWVDAGECCDAGIALDARVQGDAGVRDGAPGDASRDAGQGSRDDGGLADSGDPRDGGLTDSGDPRDGGLTDSGAPRDGGLGRDAGASTDGGPPVGPVGRPCSSGCTRDEVCLGTSYCTHACRGSYGSRMILPCDSGSYCPMSGGAYDLCYVDCTGTGLCPSGTGCRPSDDPAIDICYSPP